MARATRLFTPQELHVGETLNLEKKASHHLIKVLRAKAGMPLELFNGDGFNYDANLDSCDNKNALITLLKKTSAANESHLNITLLQGLSRGDRMDATIQKSVELGVNVIVPMICERSNYSLKQDRINKKMEHWQQIIISACEQSGRATIPHLADIQAYKETVTTYPNNHKIILSVDAGKNLSDLQQPDNNICLCIGPEGGLTPEEVEFATDKNYTNIQFGPRTLRTETAGPAVIAAMQTLWGDF